MPNKFLSSSAGVYHLRVCVRNYNSLYRYITICVLNLNLLCIHAIKAHFNLDLFVFNNPTLTLYFIGLG
jgi:hypothetical protein